MALGSCGRCVILIINHMCPLVGIARTNSTLGPWEQEVGASAPAGVPIRLSRGFPREWQKVSLPCLRPKAMFGQGPAGQPRSLGVGAKALLGTLCSLQASLPHNLHPGGHGWKRAGECEGTQAPGSRVSAPWALPIQDLGSCLPLLTPAREELTDPQGPWAGTNGSADYRCLLIKELNPFVFLAPILGSLEAPRARNWSEERYKG